jgi:AIPR protein
MAKNDLFLVDAIFSEFHQNNCKNHDKGEAFELFSLKCLLQDEDVDFEEIIDGQVDGGQDGGIDAIYVFFNDQLIKDEGEIALFSKARSCSLRLVVVSSKHAASFQIEPVEKLISSLPELLDFSTESDAFVTQYNDAVLDKRELFMAAYKGFAHLHPVLKIDLVLTSRGDDTSVAPEIVSRAGLLNKNLIGLFANCKIDVNFVGASKLLQLCRKVFAEPLRLKFTEGPISRGKSDYLVLSKLGEFFSAVTDEDGKLKKHLFEANVRDYLGQVSVNRDVEETILNRKKPDIEDFWWLNNGVTILGLKATPAGKELVIQDARIVNGLQTTETIYNAIASNHDLRSDDRAVLIKVVVSESVGVHDRIIKATNNQSQVDAASLRATDKIQRDIEDVLIRKNWFYDRRRHYYRNQSKPIERIVSPTYLGLCIKALVLADPVRAIRAKTKFLRDDKLYKSVFNDSWDIQIFPKALDFCKQVEAAVLNIQSIPGYWSSKSDFVRLYKFHLVFIVASLRCGTRYLHSDAVLKISSTPILQKELLDAWQIILDTRRTAGGKFNTKRLHRNREFAQETLKTLDAHFKSHS